MSDTAKNKKESAKRFPSLAALREKHTALLQQRAEPDEVELTTKINQFVRMGAATGEVIEAEADRWAAQSLLDYWSSQLLRMDQEVPDASLLAFNPELTPILQDHLCPYLGLDAFQEKNREFFFGRQRMVDLLVERITEEDLIAVLGPSGAGKSSLVRAGLLPVLKSGGIEGSEKWQFLAPMVPGSSPLFNLARRLKQLLTDCKLTSREIKKMLEEDSAALVSLLEEYLPNETVLIVVDQFEELFTLCEDLASRTMFIENLRSALKSKEGRSGHKLILTMRSDFENHLARQPEFQSDFERGVVRMAPLTASELRDVIEKPAALVGLKFEEGVVDALLGDILGEPAALPLLQFSLLKLWDGRQRNRVTWEVYHEMGGGRQALANSADRFYKSLIPEEQVTVRRIFSRIVRPGTGLEVTSNRIRRESLYAEGEAPDRIDRVLDKLVAERLVRLTEGRARADDQVEVAHEALVRNWPRLVNWLEDERIQLRERLRLTSAAEQWRALNEDSSALLRGRQLEEADQYNDLNTLETSFVAASRKLAEKEAQMQAARQQAFIYGVIFLFVFLIAAVILFRHQANQNADLATENEIIAITAQADKATAESASTLAVEQQSTAQAASTLALEKHDEALAQRGTAIAERDVAATAQADADQKSDLAATAQVEAELQAVIAAQAAITAKEQAAIALSRQLASQASSVQSNQLGLSLLLGIEAFRINDTFEAESVILKGLQQSLSKTVAQLGSPIYTEDGIIRSLAFSVDGEVLAYGTEDGFLKLWDVRKQELSEKQPPYSHDEIVFSAAFSPDGRYFVSGGSDGSLMLWDMQSDEVYELDRQKTWYTAVSFSPDGRLLAAARNTELVLYDVVTRTEVRVFQGHWQTIWCLDWSPDGARLVTGSNDKSVRIWGILAGDVKVLQGHEDTIRGIAWSPNGQNIVSGGKDGQMIVWNAQNGQKLDVFTTDEKYQVLSVAFSPNGKMLATASSDNTVYLWNTATWQYEQLTGHTHWVMTVAFSSDGERLASGGVDQTVILWQLTNQQQLGQVYASTSLGIDAFRIDGDGTFLYANATNRLAAVRDGATQNMTSSYPGNYSSAAFGRLGGRDVLALGGRDGAVEFADLETATLLDVNIQAAQMAILSLAISPDGKYMVTSHCGDQQPNEFCSESVIQIWDMQTKEVVRLPIEHADSVTSLAFSSDGARLASGSRDGTVILWDLWRDETAKILLKLTGHNSAVESLAFNVEGNRLASGSEERKIILWDVNTGQALGGTFTGAASSVTSLAFTMDGTQLYSGDARGQMMIWDMSIDSWLNLACQAASRNLTQSEWQRYFPDQDYRSTCEENEVKALSQN